MASILDIFRRKAAPAPVQASSPENPSTSLSNPDLWMAWGYGGNGGRFGEPVTEQSALANSTVFRCIAIISGLIATLPLRVYRDDPDLGRVEASDHRTADLFNIAPNPARGPSAFGWKETLSTHILLYGNAFAIIRYDQAARIVGFDPAPPTIVEVRIQEGRQVYVVKWPHADKEIVDQADMLHFTGPLALDGVMGLPRIRGAARDSISIARSIQETTGAAFQNAIRPSTMIKVPRDVTTDAMRRVAAFFSGEGGGQLNAGKPLFLQSDMDATPFAVPMGDLLAIDAARYSVSEISRFFGVPLVLLNETQNTTAFGAGISELVRGLLRFTLDPDLTRIENEVNRKVFSKSSYYVLFDRDALLATDPKSMAETIATEITSGVLTVNEARQKRHRGRVPNGDTILVNSASIPLDRAVNQPAPAAKDPVNDPPPAEPDPPAEPPV